MSIKLTNNIFKFSTLLFYWSVRNSTELNLYNRLVSDEPLWVTPCHVNRYWPFLCCRINFCLCFTKHKIKQKSQVDSYNNQRKRLISFKRGNKIATRSGKTNYTVLNACSYAHYKVYYRVDIEIIGILTTLRETFVIFARMFP